MPMTLSGDGTITGLAAGGLPDSSIVTADIANASVTAAKLDGAQSGSAPIYGARAWVNFNGTGTVAIRASGNVSSITDNGTGDYTVNFTTALADANYSAVGMVRQDNTNGNRGAGGIQIQAGSSLTTSSIRLLTAFGATASSDGAADDVPIACISIFR
jgi:hypothetical protein